MAVSGISGVLCCGNVVFDVAVWPVESCDWNTTTWVDTITEGIGGNGANTSYALAALGVPVRLVSVLGDDERGRKLLTILNSAGVDTSGVRRITELPTSATVVLVHQGGDRKFLHRPGASRDLSAADLRDFRIAGITHLHMANPFALPMLREETATVLRRARESGLTTSVDTGWDSRGRWLMDLGPALPYTDLLFVNEAEARLLGNSDDTRTAIQKLQGCGVRDIIVKTGALGCSIYTQNFVDDVPPFSVEAIDTTGAGDCFAGAFLAGLTRGWTYTECASFANAVGAMNVEHIGAITGLRSFDETLAWMRARRPAA